MAWVIKTRIEDKSFQKEAAQRIISAKTKKYRSVGYVQSRIMTLFGNVVKVKTIYYRARRTKGRKCKSQCIS
jgi:hypothetical protein